MDSLHSQVGPAPRSARLGRCVLWVVAMCAAAIASACGSDSAVTTSPTQVKCQVTLAAPGSSIGADGGMGSVTVTTSPECPWDASTAATWLSELSPVSGQGTGTVQFRAAPNPQAATREGDIVVNGTRVRVSQGPAPCRVEFKTGSLNVDVDGGPRQVEVSAASGCSWAVATDANWITFTTPTSGSGDGTVGFRITPNTGNETRTGSLALGDQRLTVSQAGAVATTCSYTIGLASSISLAASGGTGTVSVATGAGCAWTAASTVPWITVVSGNSGTGSGAVAFSVASNQGGLRSGTVTVAGQSFTVTQAAAANPCAYAISPVDSSLPASGGTGTVAVATAAGCGWTATSNADWITVTSGASGSANGAVGFRVADNAGAARSGTIAVADQTFTVRQAAAATPCTYAITPSTGTMGASGGAGTIDVATASGCTWTASSSASWITVTSGASGSGNGPVGFSVAANTGAARTGSLTVAGHTFTMTQAAAATACTYTINPSSGSIGAPGGTGTVDVATASGCTWTASSNANWIAITSGGSGSGNGPVAFSVAANTGAARTGTLTVAGHTFTMAQAAAAAPPCTYAISPTSASLGDTGGTGSIDVTSATGCAWTGTSNASWITVTSGGSGSGNGRLAFSVSRNTGAARTGTLTVAGQTFTVTQAAAPPVCAYTLSPKSVNLSNKAQADTVDVSTASGCAWTAKSNDSWLVVVSGATGSGKGTVTFGVTKNSGKNDRVGTLTIAGNTFTVTQKN